MRETERMLEEGNSRLQNGISKADMAEIRIASAIIDSSSRLRIELQEKLKDMDHKRQRN